MREPAQHEGPPAPATEQVQERVAWRSHRNVILATLATGHGIKHWFNQAFWVIFPLIKTDLGLSPVQAGLIVTARQTAGGLSTIPTGALSDMHRRRWPMILAMSLLGVGLAYLLVGLSPSYALLLVGVGLTGIATAAWHPPALAILARRFPERRGFSVAVHTGGASVGETLAPLATGFILLLLTWRQFFTIGAIPAVIVALAVWWSLAGIGGEPGPRPSLREYGRGLRTMLRNAALLSLLLLAALRSMAHISLLTFLTIYLREDRGMSGAGIGLHISLLTFLGIVAGPVMGALSDRYGRKPVLFLGFVSIGAGVLLLALFGQGWQLTAIVAFLGAFMFTIQPIVIAAAMDAVKGMEATTVAVLFSANNIFAGLSPLIAGVLVSATGTNITAFYYVAALTLTAALLLPFLPLARTVPHPPQELGL